MSFFIRWLFQSRRPDSPNNDEDDSNKKNKKRKNKEEEESEMSWRGVQINALNHSLRIKEPPTKGTYVVFPPDRNSAGKPMFK